MALEALGRVFDISTGVVPVDLQTAQTGKRVSLKNAGGCTIVIFKAAGTAGDDPTFTLQEANAASGGTAQDLAIITKYYLKTEATLDGDETWVKETQSAAATIVDPGGDTTSAEHQQIIAIEVDASDLSDGFTHLLLNTTDTGTNAQLGCVLYFLHDLAVQRTPANLAAPQ